MSAITSQATQVSSAIPKSVSLTARVQGIVQNALHYLAPSKFESSLAQGVRLLRDVTSGHETEALSDSKFLERYNVLAANFLEPFRSCICSISATDPNQRFKLAKSAFTNTLARLNQVITSNDHLVFHLGTMKALYHEFFDFVANNYKLEVGKTGTVANLSFVAEEIFQVFKDNNSPHFISTEQVQTRLTVYIVGRLLPMSELCKFKAKQIVGVDKDVECDVKRLKKEISPLEKELEAFENIEGNFPEKKQLITSVFSKREELQTILDSVYFSEQMDQYRLNLFRIGVELDKASKECLTAAAKVYGFESIQDWIDSEEETFPSSPKDQLDPERYRVITLIRQAGSALKREYERVGCIENFGGEIEGLIENIRKDVPKIGVSLQGVRNYLLGLMGIGEDRLSLDNFIKKHAYEMNTDWKVFEKISDYEAQLQYLAIEAQSRYPEEFKNLSDEEVYEKFKNLFFKETNFSEDELSHPKALNTVQVPSRSGTDFTGLEALMKGIDRKFKKT